MNNISFNITEYDEDPDGNTLTVEINMSASANGFTGRGSTEIYLNDMKIFIDRLSSFVSHPKGEVSLVGGLGDTELINFRFFALDELGHIGIELQLSEEHSDGLFRVGTFYSTEPMLVERFKSNLEDKIENKQVGPVNIEVLKAT